MKKKRGAPTKRAEERLSVIITFSVTEHDAQQLYREARRVRLSLSTFIRLQLKDLGLINRKNTEPLNPV